MHFRPSCRRLQHTLPASTRVRRAASGWVAGLLLGLGLCSAPAGAQDAETAQQLISAGKANEALPRIEQALSRRPDDVQLRFLKGVALSDQQRKADAIAQFEALIRDHPLLPEPYNNLGVLYAEEGNYDKARTALEMAVRVRPGYARAHENLGDVFVKLASQAYSRSLELDSDSRSTPPKLALVRRLLSSAPSAPPARSGR
ncbi:tetratricopeptide repeat protein [Caldimonas brevitalea]|uniref:Uncharacterized protein n=1 Tax=Caldimonas brevitalea TaxID=413882 RepID=A0A0G3BH38_9BURK|nr:tetratricopeptide repeat protein [Caldimonas brevitalea]AKJ28667.1 hypothetical protein AAW51_1976 [Caldimonas brevitalea]